MKKDVYISIKGSQEYEDDQNKMEVTTAGKFYDKDGKYNELIGTVTATVKDILGN